MIGLIAALAVGAGLALAVLSLLQRAKERDDDLAAILQLPFGERDIPIEAVTESRAALLERSVTLATEGLEHFNLMAKVAGQLERARLPLATRASSSWPPPAAVSRSASVRGLPHRPGCSSACSPALAGPFLAWNFVKFKVARRRKAFEAQLPDALSLIASSLQAGHTALRSVQSMVEESEPPLSEEFERVVAETALGDPLVDALERMAQRLDVEDLAWVVQAIRIQQTVGGKLADLLYTLAEFMRGREEIRREVKVLTAEGRMSAWVLGGLPVLLFFFVKTQSPDYLDPMLHDAGPLRPHRSGGLGGDRGSE